MVILSTILCSRKKEKKSRQGWVFMIVEVPSEVRELTLTVRECAARIEHRNEHIQREERKERRMKKKK